MQDLADSTDSQLTPPAGDSQKAEKYLSRLINLISQDKVLVHHTDLTKFDPSALEDHYRVDLKEFQIEVSHSKQPNSGKDSYVLLFTNLKNLKEQSCEKVILAYMHINEDQFDRFKGVSFRQIEQRRFAEEEKRLKQALEPIDTLLDQIETGNLNSNPMELEDIEKVEVVENNKNNEEYSDFNPLENPPQTPDDQQEGQQNIASY